MKTSALFPLNGLRNRPETLTMWARTVLIRGRMAGVLIPRRIQAARRTNVNDPGGDRILAPRLGSSRMRQDQYAYRAISGHF